MSSGDPTAPFFVGYFRKVPAPLVRFLQVVMVALVGGFAGLAFAVAVSQDDPGDGGFRWDLGYQTMTGVVDARPYPVLYLPPSGAHPQGHAVLLSGLGKSGVQVLAERFAGGLVDAGGTILRRGDLDMLQVGGKVAIRPSRATQASQSAGFRPPAPVDLGTWRLTGEICDGKCYTGAMRPGRGLAHKACANVCLTGGLPPVFVATDDVDGRSFFLLADRDGNPLPARSRDYVAQMIRVDGAIERRGDLHVFRIDLSTAERLP